MSFTTLERFGRGLCDREKLQRVEALQPETPVDLHDEVAHVVMGCLAIRPWTQNDAENVVVAFLAAKAMYEAEGHEPDLDALAELIATAEDERPTPEALRRRLSAIMPL